MSVKKDQRFNETNLKVQIRSKEFPPETFQYGGFALTLLGRSNKDDLIPVNIDNEEMVRAVTYGSIGQYIYSSQIGDLYDACLYQDRATNIYLGGIRTRQLPDKPKKQKEEEK